MENNRIKRILLIDDDVYIVELLSILLASSSCEMITAQNGKQAVEVLSNQSIDMIILDLMMPEMDGLVFLHWLREEANATTPVLVFTGVAAPDTEKQVMAAGATALVYKPIKVPDLLAKIQQLEQLI